MPSRQPARCRRYFASVPVTSVMARFLGGILLVWLAAALWAQPQASSSRSAPKVKSSLPESGAISQGVYHNRAFDFSYKLPFAFTGTVEKVTVELK